MRNVLVINDNTGGWRGHRAGIPIRIGDSWTGQSSREDEDVVMFGNSWRGAPPDPPCFGFDRCLGSDPRAMRPSVRYE